jgi:hypothetical protein
MRKFIVYQVLVETMEAIMMDVDEANVVAVASVRVDTTQATKSNIVKLSKDVIDYTKYIDLHRTQVEYYKTYKSSATNFVVCFRNTG